MSTRPRRETAYRVFAAEFDHATLSYTESDEERAPNYVVTPTGARVNRLFLVGVLTEVESVNEEQLRARVVDPTGAFVVYAGQYQPEVLSFLERAEVPTFVAVTGKARTFQPEDSNQVYTSVRPETLSEVDATTRDRWTVRTAERTTERVETMASVHERDERGDALAEVLSAEGVEPGLAAGIPLALDHYGTTAEYLDAIGKMALDAARVVAGERDEVPALSVAPGEGSSPDTSAAGEPPAGTTSTEPSETAPRADDATTANDGTRPSTEMETTDGADEPQTVTPEAAATADSANGSETEPGSTNVESDTTTGLEHDVADDGEAAPANKDDERDVAEGGVEMSSGEPTVDDGTDGEDTEFDPEAFELDDEERERIENEYGTDFESAAEVDEPGEAGIETPDVPGPDEVESADTDHTGTTEPDDVGGATDAASATESAGPTDGDAEIEGDEIGADETGAGEPGENEPATADEPTDEEPDAAADLDPEDAVVEAMRELDDGDGAEREAVIERVAETGLSREDAEEGIQSALMSGECYEPDDDTLKPI